jgi:serine phosphatase RsbU (regulator of sigma subunit)
LGTTESVPDRLPEGRAKRRLLHVAGALVLVAGLALTAGLTIASRLSYLHNEQRLTTLQAKLTATAIGLAPADLERRIGAAVTGAAQAADPVAVFRSSIASSMAPRGPFVTAVLALVQGEKVTILSRVGAPPLSPGASRDAVFVQAARSATLVTTRVESGGQQRFGFLMSARGPSGTYVGGAGESVPTGNHVSIPASSPFADLEFALYYGTAADPDALVETNATHLPLTGTVAQETVPFGDHALLLVISPRGSLAGPWSELLPWGVLVAGVIFTLGIAAMTERIVRRREIAEELAAENRRLFQEQRRVAETLQRSLLPRSLPERADVELAVRYVPGTSGVDIGGDWYDVVDVGPDRLFFTVGDVAGRGLEAAALMATLRNAIKAFALDGSEPATVLSKTARLLDVERDGRFATVLCGVVDLSGGGAELANAGHLAPLLIGDGRREYVPTTVGLPLGVTGGDPYTTVRVAIGHGETLLAFTDGLVERRDEPLDAGLERLREAVPAGVTLERLLDDVMAALVASGVPDDVALLGLRRA